MAMSSVGVMINLWCRMGFMCVVGTLLVAVLAGSKLAAEEGETLRLEVTADVGLSSMFWENSDERTKSWGKAKSFKLKSIQEMSAVRFDVSAATGYEIRSAKLFLCNASSKNRIRFLRLSTVSSDWIEGTQTKPYGPPDGACFNYADWNSKSEWAWPGSQFCDVVFGAGHSITTWAERKEHKKNKDSWISVELPPALIYAMCVGSSDGIAIQDGGDLTYTNNHIYSRESSKDRAPYIEVELGAPLKLEPATPRAQVEPGVGVASVDAGALKVSIDPDQNVFCWEITVNGKQVERWQIARPRVDKNTEFHIEFLEPAKQYLLEIRAVSAGGLKSKPLSVTATSSARLSLPVKLTSLSEPKAGNRTPHHGAKDFDVWVCPGLVKVSPESGKVMFKDAQGDDYSQANAVWDGEKIALAGCRGEYVSCQVIVQNKKDELKGVRVSFSPLRHKSGAVINQSEIELYKNWYAQNKKQQWQPAYCVPVKHDEPFIIPDPIRKLATQKNQGIYVDVYIPKNAQAGVYSGMLTTASGGGRVEVPIEIEVFDFSLPDKLCFWPQLNVYGWGIPGNLLLPAYKLAQQHRNVFFFRGFRPALSGNGKDIKVDWSKYDKQLGSLLSGEAFKDNRRPNQPIEALALPFMDSWPTNLNKETYQYKGKWILAKAKDKKELSEFRKSLNEHYMTCPRIENGLTDDYKNAFISVQKQFIDHFKEKNWNQTESQCLFMGKNTHRIQYKVNMWWTTDEPYHWVDWLALRFFAKMWTDNRGEENKKNWAYRADISRPQWQGQMLDGIVDNIHFGTGAMSSPTMYRRIELLARNGEYDKRIYGAANQDNTSNLGSIVWFAGAWLNGANAALPWQSMGNKRALDVNDRAVGGNALMAPAKERLGVDVVADMRLKAFRDGQQLIEYMNIFIQRYGISRTQAREIIGQVLDIKMKLVDGASADNAEAMRFATVKAWQIAELRRALAEAIVKKK